MQLVIPSGTIVQIGTGSFIIRHNDDNNSLTEAPIDKLPRGAELGDTVKLTISMYVSEVELSGKHSIGDWPTE
ncbi:MAG: hypothetical protein R3250_18065 [Melioribacteraceae bacterium]|nr:hypothetical protein [Melioribacteraceae bacterium]